MKLKTTYRIIIISAIVLPALLLSLIGLSLFNSSMSSMMRQETASLSYAASVRVEQYFKHYETALQTYACDSVIKTAASGDYASVKNEVSDIFEAVKTANANILDISVLDTSGLVIAAANETTVQKSFFAYDDPLIATADGGVYVSPIYVDNEKYFDNVIVFAAPIAISDTSRGYICEVVSANEIYNILKTETIFDEGSLVLVDVNGNAINYNGEVVTRTEAMLASPFADEISNIHTENVSGEQKYNEFSNSGKIGAYGAFSSFNWGWIGTCPSSIIGARTSNPLFIGICIFLVFFAIDTVIAFAVYKKSISPIRKMTESINEIKKNGVKGDIDTRIASGSGNYEFDVIADVFNALLDDASISEEIHRTVSEHSNNMLFEWNLDENRMYASENFKNNFNVDIAKASLLDGKFIDSLMTDGDAQKFRRGLSALLKDKDYYEEEFEIQTKNNGKVWYLIRAKAVATRLGDIIRIIGVLTDINDKKQMNLQLSQRASFDFLSQLYNRSTFLCDLQNKLDLKNANEKYAILFIDVDDFKFINDRYGHNVGDEVIKYVADTIKSKLGSSGFAGRFGGDEFVICVSAPEVTSNIDEFAMSIIDELYNGYRCETAKVLLNIKVSVGISLFPEHGKTADELVGSADEAMYFVKKNGKANYHIFSPHDAPSLDLSNTII